VTVDTATVLDAPLDSPLWLPWLQPTREGVNLWSAREFDDLNPRQRRDMVDAARRGLFDFQVEAMPDLRDVAQLSPRHQRLILDRIKGGAFNDFQIASAGLTTATTAYTSGDMLGTELTLTNMSTIAGASLTIMSASLIDYAKVTGAVDWYIFNAAAAGVAGDNAANSFTDQTAFKAVIGFVAGTASALNSFSQVANVGMSMATAAVTSLFADAVTRSGHTFFGAATDLKYTITVLRDV
jgi:hypothetical protein